MPALNKIALKFLLSVFLKSFINEVNNPRGGGVCLWTLVVLPKFSGNILILYVKDTETTCLSPDLMGIFYKMISIEVS